MVRHLTGLPLSAAAERAAAVPGAEIGFFDAGESFQNPPRRARRGLVDCSQRIDFGRRRSSLAVS